MVVEPRRFATLDDILARAIERGEPPFVLAMDSLEDPQNVGTLLRSAEASGVHGVLFPTRRQAPLSPAAVKASAGAVEHLLLAPVDDLAGALADLHVRGLRIAGAEAEAPLTARDSDLRGPLAIVVGSEGQGLGPAIRRRCDLLMRIPMRGAIESLNAAVAGSILLFEAVAQRTHGAGAVPDAAAPDAAAPEAAVPGGPPARRTRKAKPTSPSDNEAAPKASATPKAPARRTRKAKPSAPSVRETAVNLSASASPARRARKARPPAGSSDEAPTDTPAADLPNDAEALLPGGPAQTEPPTKARRTPARRPKRA